MLSSKGILVFSPPSRGAPSALRSLFGLLMRNDLLPACLPANNTPATPIDNSDGSSSLLPPVTQRNDNAAHGDEYAREHPTRHLVFLRDRPDDQNYGAKASGSRTAARLRQNRMRGVLVTAEVALAVVLLCGAVLLIRSFSALHSVSLGFDPSQLLTMEISLAGHGYVKSSSVDRVAGEFVERAARIPGVESAAVASALPLWGQMDMIFDIPGRVRPAGRQVIGDVQWRIVSSHDFDVLRIPLLSGRRFNERETHPTVIIS